ncbi:hypothetical protein ACRDNQ_07090 [Palleronia sp. KMU-117]|uniref:hypothetical protein n=1 Tax=Palleronia sp. KMU-117 TaxID=3434108 RepID=UPI003D754762
MVAAGLTVVAGSAVSQEGGLTFSGRFAESLEFSDNPDFTEDFSGTALTSRTTLGFGLASVTAAQSLALDLGAAWRYTLSTSDNQPTREGLTDPFVRLDYERNSATSLLGFDASYSESDTGDLNFVTDPDSQDIIVDDDGTVARTTLNFGLDTGIGEPFGLSVDAGYSRRTYFDTTDPDLVDNETFDLRGVARFRITPTTDANLIGAYIDDREFDTVDGYERSTVRLGAGIDHEISGTQRFGFDVTADTIDTTESGATTTEEGYSFILAYDQDLMNGGFSVEASSILENIGTRNSVSFSRSLDLPDGGLFLLVGLTNNDTSDVNALIGVDYTRDLSDGQLTARVRQDVTQSSTEDNEFLNRLISIDYAKEVNSVSGWQTSIGYNESEDLSNGSVDSQARFEISYRRDLTQDWDIVTGYRYREQRSTDENDRTSNTVFLTLQRDFQGRP